MATNHLGSEAHHELDVLVERSNEIYHSINDLCHFCLPEFDRRANERRLRERRTAQSDAQFKGQRSGRDRRDSDRRLPLGERLSLLRSNMETVLHRQIELMGPRLQPARAH